MSDRARRGRHAAPGQTMVFFAVVLPVLLAVFLVVYGSASLTGAQEQANFSARAAALAALSAINGATGAITDTQVTPVVGRLLQDRPYAQVVFTTTTTTPPVQVVYVTGVYSPSLVPLGSGSATTLQGTAALTVTLTAGVGVTFGSAGGSIFAVHAQAVATNCAGKMLLNTPCTGP